MCDKQKLRPACTYVQSGQSLCPLLEYSMAVNLLTEQHLEFLSLKGGCTGSSESTHVKMPHCWKSYVVAHLFNQKKMLISESTTHVYVPTSHAGIQSSLIDMHMQLSDPVGFCMNLYFFTAGETAKKG